MKDIILGVLIFIAGFLIGFLFSDDIGMKDPITELISEVKMLQKDLVRVEIQTTENFVKINYLEFWRDSILFRPPEKKPKSTKTK